MAIAELETEAPQTVRCWIENRRIHIDLADERTISFPASKFPRLAVAPSEMLQQVTLRVQVELSDGTRSTKIFGSAMS